MAPKKKVKQEPNVEVPGNRAYYIYIYIIIKININIYIYIYTIHIYTQYTIFNIHKHKILKKMAIQISERQFLKPNVPRVTL